MGNASAFSGQYTVHLHSTNAYLNQYGRRQLSPEMIAGMPCCQTFEPKGLMEDTREVAQITLLNDT